MPDHLDHDVVDLEALKPAYTADPYPVYARLRRRGGARRVRYFGIPAWLITGYEDVKQALSDPRLTTNPRHAGPAAQAAPWLFAEEMMGLGRHMLRSDPPDHARLRRLVSKAFTPRRIESLRPRIQSMADELLSEVLPAGKTELMHDFAFPLPLMVIMDLLGVPLEDRESFRRWADMIELSGPGTEETVIEGLMAIRSYLTSLVDKRTRQPRVTAHDLLSELVDVRDQGQRLTEEELLAMAWLLIGAGHSTTVDLIGNGMFALLTHRRQLTAIRGNPALLGPAIDEFLRFDGPVEIAIVRFTTTDVPIGDIVIPGGGEVVLACLAAADRDPAMFQDPDLLEISRADTRHLAFGHGAHYCLGASLARLEGQIAFAALLDRCGDIRLAVDPADVQWRDNQHLRGPVALPLTFTPAPSGAA